MRLTVLGCAGSFPGPESPCSAYLVEADGFRLLVDFGSGSMSSLQRYAGLHAPDAILLTHLHCDHIRRRDVRGGPPVRPGRALPGAADVRARRCARPAQRRVRATTARWRTSTSSTRSSRAPSRSARSRSPSTGSNHPVETYGVRLEHGGRSLCYSSDTAPCEALLRLAQNADVFLCEASYLDGVDNPPDLHLTGREAGEAATKADGGPAAAHPPGAPPGAARRTRWSRPPPRTPGRSRWSGPAPATTSDPARPAVGGVRSGHPERGGSPHRIGCRHGAT